MADEIVSTFPTATPLSTDLVPIEHQTGGTGPYTSSVATVAALVAAGGGGGSGAFGSSTDVDFTTEGSNKFLAAVASSGKPFSFQTPSGGGGSNTTYSSVPPITARQSSFQNPIGLSSATYSLPNTAGVGNLLVLYGYLSGGTVTAPTGWTQVGNSNGLMLFYRTASGTTADNFALSASANVTGTIVIQEFIAGSTPYGFSATSTGAYDYETPLLTPTGPSMVIAFYNGNQSEPLAPAGWTISSLGGGDFGSGRMLAIAWTIVPGGQPVSLNFQSDDTNTRYVGQFAIPIQGVSLPANAALGPNPTVVQYSAPSGNKPSVVSLPSAPTPGNVIIALIGYHPGNGVSYVSPSGANWPAPLAGGWDCLGVAQGDGGSLGSEAAMAWVHRVSTNEPTSYTVGGWGDNGTIQLFEIANAGLIVADAFNEIFASSTAPAFSIPVTLEQPGTALVLFGMSFETINSITPPTGWASAASSTSNNHGVVTAWGTQATSGSESFSLGFASATTGNLSLVSIKIYPKLITLSAVSPAAFPFTVVQESAGILPYGASSVFTFAQAAASGGATMILVVAYDERVTLTTPTGWTLWFTTGTGYTAIAVYTKTSAGDTSVTLAASASFDGCVYMMELAGTRTTDQHASSLITTSPFTFNCPALTPTTGAAVFVACCLVPAANTPSAITLAGIGRGWKEASINGFNGSHAMGFGFLNAPASGPIVPPQYVFGGRTYYSSSNLTVVSFSIL